MKRVDLHYQEFFCGMLPHGHQAAWARAFISVPNHTCVYQLTAPCLCYRSYCHPYDMSWWFSSLCFSYECCISGKQWASMQITSTFQGRLFYNSLSFSFPDPPPILCSERFHTGASEDSHLYPWNWAQQWTQWNLQFFWFFKKQLFSVWWKEP